MRPSRRILAPVDDRRVKNAFFSRAAYDLEGYLGAGRQGGLKLGKKIGTGHDLIAQFDDHIACCHPGPFGRAVFKDTDDRRTFPRGRSDRVPAIGRYRLDHDA